MVPYTCISPIRSVAKSRVKLATTLWPQFDDNCRGGPRSSRPRARFGAGKKGRQTIESTAKSDHGKRATVSVKSE